MIILVMGDFGVGKDVFADILVEELNKKVPDSAKKILSYTTRSPRNIKDFNNHLFVESTPDKEYFEKAEIVAKTTINNEFYWTEKQQFDKEYNIYVIDEASVKQVVKTDIDMTLLIKVVRDKTLINVSKERINRKQNKGKLPRFIKPFIIENNGTLDDLHQKTTKFVQDFFSSE